MNLLQYHPLKDITLCINLPVYSWTFQVHVSLYLKPEEAGFIGKWLMSQEVVVEMESCSNKPDCRIQLLD